MNTNHPRGETAHGRDPFRIRARGSTPWREIMAGATSFATMAFVIIVNPAIMAGSGMDRVDLTMATALAAMMGSLVVGLLSNLPLVAAPAMGSNVIFAAVLVRQLGIPWQAGLAMVFVTGALFLVLSLTGMRERVFHAVPPALRVGIQAGIGGIIILVALRNAGVVIGTPGLLLRLAPLGNPGVLVSIAGILVTSLLMIRGVPGALLVSIVALTAIGTVVPDGHGGHLTHLPQRFMAWPHWPRTTAFQLNFTYLWTHLLLCLPLMVYFFCSEFFSTLGTLITATAAVQRHGTTPDAPLQNGNRVFGADAVASMAGALVGTAVVTVFVESVTGIEAGGRTGFTAVVAAILFALSLFLWPVLVAIPAFATAPAMVMIGILMMQGLAQADLSRFEHAVPTFATMAGAILTANLVNGLALGIFSFLVVETGQGRVRAVSPIIWGLAAIFIGFYTMTLRFG